MVNLPSFLFVVAVLKLVDFTTPLVLDSGSMADHDLKPLALRQLGFDDTASSSAQLSFLDSSATGVLPSDPDHFSNDIDLSILLEGTEPLTEAALKNSCVSQDPVSEDLLARDETSSCPAPVPLAPANEQIFNDPLNWLERTLLDDKPPSTYPGRLSPEEEQEREDDPDGQYWNTNSIDGEEWHEYNPCEPYLELGYINALCCSGRSSLVTDLSVIMVWFMKYEWVKDCDPSLGTFCTAQYDICCRDYYPFLRVGSQCLDNLGGAQVEDPESFIGY